MTDDQIGKAVQLRELGCSPVYACAMARRVSMLVIEKAKILVGIGLCPVAALSEAAKL